MHDLDLLTEVQRRLGVEFTDLSLLSNALTHQSYINEQPQDGPAVESYERLEFLGDAVLNESVARRLFEAMPEADEGTLTLGRSHVVCRDSLASVAREMGLGKWIVFGNGESDASVRDSVLEDVYESVLGAVYVDQGTFAAEHFITQSLGDSIRDVIVNGVEKNPKSKFQESVQAFGLPTPRYMTRQISPDGAYPMSFESEVYVADLQIATAISSGKTRAEKLAAQEGCELFEKGIPVALRGRVRRTAKVGIGVNRTAYPRRKLDLMRGDDEPQRSAVSNPFRWLWLRLSGALPSLITKVNS